VLAAELFPARLRSTCHAISAAAGTAGAITTAYEIQNLNIGGYMVTIKKGLVMLAITNFLGFFLTFLIPETMGQSLEEISGEDDNASIRADSAWSVESYTNN
jgi:MFS transporter, PHS family, inorganic phosphate transporter